MMEPTGSPQEIYQQRKDLAEQRYQRKEALRQLTLTRAQTEQRAIAEVASAHDVPATSKALGDNPDDRARALLLALEDSATYGELRNRVASFERAIEQAETRLAYLLDLRRQGEWRIRLRLAEALAAQASVVQHAQAAEEAEASDDEDDEELSDLLADAGVDAFTLAQVVDATYRGRTGG